MCAMFKRLGMGLKRGAMKLSGAKIAADEEFEERKALFLRDQKRVIALRKKVTKAMNDTRGLGNMITKVGKSYLDLFSSLNESLAQSDEDEEEEVPIHLTQFQESFEAVVEVLQEFTDSLREEANELVSERVREYRDMQNGVVHRRDRSKLDLDKANSIVEKMEKRANADEGKLETFRTRAEDAQSKFTELNDEAEGELDGMIDAAPQFISKVAKTFVDQGQDLTQNLTDKLGYVTDALGGISSAISGAGGGMTVRSRPARKAREAPPERAAPHEPDDDPEPVKSSGGQSWRSPAASNPAPSWGGGGASARRRPPPRSNRPPVSASPPGRPARTRPPARGGRGGRGAFGRGPPPGRPQRTQSKWDSQPSMAPPPEPSYSGGGGDMMAAPPPPSGGRKKRRVAKKVEGDRGQLFADINKGGFRLKKVPASQQKRPKSPATLAREQETRRARGPDPSEGGFMGDLAGALARRRQRN